MSISVGSCFFRAEVRSIFAVNSLTLGQEGVLAVGSVRNAIALAGSMALVAASSAAAAQPLAQPAAVQPAAVQPAAPNAWMMLSVLSPTRSVALGGAAAVAQPADVPPPPPPAVAGGAMADGVGEVIPFVLWFGLIALALTSSGESGAPNSPA
jgi:hypothetical protein